MNAKTAQQVFNGLKLTSALGHTEHVEVLRKLLGFEGEDYYE